MMIKLDSSSLIISLKMDYIDILIRLYGELVITKAVNHEVIIMGKKTFDTIGKPRFRDEYRMTGDEIRLEVLCAMVKAGFEDQILLSHDISNPDYLSTNGGHGYIHLLGEFVPRLHDRLSETTIEKFIIHNPRRALEF